MGIHGISLEFSMDIVDLPIETGISWEFYGIDPLINQDMY